MEKHKPDVQMNDTLSLTLLNEEKMESDEEEEGDIIFSGHRLEKEDQKLTVIFLFLWWELGALAPRREWELLLQKVLLKLLQKVILKADENFLKQPPW